MNVPEPMVVNNVAEARRTQSGRSFINPHDKQRHSCQLNCLASLTLPQQEDDDCDEESDDEAPEEKHE